jgi:hypothetical protein
VSEPRDERKHEKHCEHGRRADQFSEPMPLDRLLSIDVNHRVRLSLIID